MRAMFGVLALCVLLIGGTAAWAQTGAATVTADRTSVRDKAATDGAVVATVTRGEGLTVLAASGAWLRVRTSSGVEGFIHSLFVSQGAGGAAAQPAAPTPAAPPAAQPASPVVGGASQRQPMFGSTGTPMDDRTLGLGFGGGGLSFGFQPSVRYWLGENVGVEAVAAFYSRGYLGSSYRHTAISPSLLFRISNPGTAGEFKFLPYAGGGATIWSYSSSYRNQFVDFSDTSITFGGFIGGEAVFARFPNFTVSGSVGYYTSPTSLGFGGLSSSIGFHYYIK